MSRKSNNTLTTQEREVLGLAYDAAAGNGFDFGIVEEIEWPDRKALGGLLASLAKKGYITVHATTYVNGTTRYRRDRRSPSGFREVCVGGDPVTQFVFDEPLDFVRARCGRE